MASLPPAVHHTNTNYISSYRSSRRYLLQYAVTTATSRRYNHAVDLFLEWVDNMEYDATSTNELDELLLDYFHQLYEDGHGKSLAVTTLYGILLRMPHLKYQLHASHQTIRAWSRIVPYQSYPPLTWELAVIIAIQMTRAGYICYGIGVLVAFDALLRVSELCSLMITDIADDGDRRISTEHKGMLIHLRSTKTGKNQWVNIVNPSIKLLIRWLLTTFHSSNRSYASSKQLLLLSPKHNNKSKHNIINSKQSSSATKLIDNHYRLFPFSPAQFRNILKSTCSNLSLSNRYVPHSLRHGGATRYHHVHGWSIEDVLERGRWQSVKSARRYIQSGVAMLMSMDTPTHISKIAIDMSRDPYHNIISLYNYNHSK
jgi:integrase